MPDGSRVEIMLTTFLFLALVGLARLGLVWFGLLRQCLIVLALLLQNISEKISNFDKNNFQLEQFPIMLTDF